VRVEQVATPVSCRPHDARFRETLRERIRADIAEAELIELTIGQLMQFTTMWL
jgi:hypothetical protein